MNRALLLIYITWLGGCSGGSTLDAGDPDAPITGLRLLGEHVVPFEATVSGMPIGGLSGIDRTPDGTWFFLSDDRSNRAPSRFFTAEIAFDESGFETVDFTGVVSLLGADGQPLPAFAADPEALRFDAEAGTLIWSSEGDRDRGIQPFIWESTRTGRFVRALPLPPIFEITATRGPRQNGVFESLSLDTGAVWIANELPLLQDGPEPALEESISPVRLTRLDAATGAIQAQFAYRLDRVAHPPLRPGDFILNGVSELLALDSERLLVLERSFSLGAGNTIRLYEADLRGATDVRDLSALDGAAYTPVQKRLVYDFTAAGLDLVDNIEGMTWGPPFRNGERTLVFVSDNNFQELQITQILVFEVLTG